MTAKQTPAQHYTKHFAYFASVLLYVQVTAPIFIGAGIIDKFFTLRYALARGKSKGFRIDSTWFSYRPF